METYNTKYGLITLYKNDVIIGQDFKNGGYWDIDTLFKLREYIDPHRNILEIGGHCGTSSIIYASFLNETNNSYNLLENINQNNLEIEAYSNTSSIYASILNEKKIYVYEPQRNMYNLLVKNINQNNLQNKIIPYNLGVFCFEGKGKMNNIDLDGGGGVVVKRYNEENNLDCNFGGITLGDDGENINLTTIDNMKLDDIGYIHCDAQGSENFIFSKGIETIKKYRPVILYENNELYGTYLYDNVCKSYPNYKDESKFDIKKYCMEQLNYSKFIDRFNNGIDTLLIP
jgi:FkbM family methyltransferase